MPRTLHVALTLALAGCGWRTGLEGEVAPRDAGFDASFDGGADAGFDAGFDGAVPLPPTVDCFSDEVIAVELRSIRRAGETRHSFGVAMVNPGDEEARYVVESPDPAGGIAPVEEGVVPPHGAARFERPLERDPLPGVCDGPGDCEVGDDCVCEPVGCFCTRLGAEPPRYRAYRVRSDRPIGALQVHPSNADTAASADTSALIPTARLGRRYTVVSWWTTFGPPAFSRVLPTFVTVVATRPGTVTIRMHPRAGPVYTSEGDRVGEGETITARLGELETLDVFTIRRMSDLSGTTIESDVPIAVFSGSTASDVPAWAFESERRCCSDHLQTMLLPDDQLGRRHFVLVPPNRSREVNAAATSGPALVEQPDPIYAKVVATEDGTEVTAGDERVTLGRGDVHLFAVEQPTLLVASAPIAALLATSGTRNALPMGAPISLGDPSITALPPVVPVHAYAPFVLEGYPFDYVLFGTDATEPPTFDGMPAAELCEATRAGAMTQYTCRLSSPSIGPPPAFVLDPGTQRDGPHFVTVEGSETSLLAVGFGSFVSYLYPGCAAAR